ncbi:hypothetical protein B23_2308 [Geobacillus thermoleovorans B23]|nr:hypothetical protein B23_2308 [Geobacillus thermoleovorans B23]
MFTQSFYRRRPFTYNKQVRRGSHEHHDYKKSV